MRAEINDVMPPRLIPTVSPPDLTEPSTHHPKLALSGGYISANHPLRRNMVPRQNYPYWRGAISNFFVPEVDSR